MLEISGLDEYVLPWAVYAFARNRFSSKLYYDAIVNGEVLLESRYTAGILFPSGSKYVNVVEPTSGYLHTERKQVVITRGKARAFLPDGKMVWAYASENKPQRVPVAAVEGRPNVKILVNDAIRLIVSKRLGAALARVWRISKLDTLESVVGIDAGPAFATVPVNINIYSVRGVVYRSNIAFTEDYISSDSTVQSEFRELFGDGWFVATNGYRVSYFLPVEVEDKGRGRIEMPFVFRAGVHAEYALAVFRRSREGVLLSIYFDAPSGTRLAAASHPVLYRAMFLLAATAITRGKRWGAVSLALEQYGMKKVVDALEDVKLSRSDEYIIGRALSDVLGDELPTPKTVANTVKQLLSLGVKPEESLYGPRAKFKVSLEKEMLRVSLYDLV